MNTRLEESPEFVALALCLAHIVDVLAPKEDNAEWRAHQFVEARRKASDFAAQTGNAVVADRINAVALLVFGGSDINFNKL